MPGGSSLPDTSIYNKAQNQELAADSLGRLKVKVDAITSTITVAYSNVTVKSVNASNACTVVTFSGAGTNSIVAAITGKSIELRGFSLCNGSTSTRRVDLKWGTTSFWAGHLAGGAGFNWNFINSYPKSASYKKLVLYCNGAATVSASVYYKVI